LVVLVALKNIECITVIFVQPVLRTYPDESFLILNDGIDRTLREPLVDGDVVEFDVSALGKRGNAQ
jgi:hypothetical protein